MKKKNNHINTLLGTALLVMVAVVVAILIITNMPATQVATVTNAPIVTSSPMATTTTVDSKWKKYSSAKYGISFEYPATTTVKVANSNTIHEYLTVTGSGDPGFWVTIASLSDAPFFNPPANTDVTQWVLHNKDYPLGNEEVKPSRTIANVKAVHLFLQGRAAPSSDMYYFIKNNRLYEVSLLDDYKNHNLPEKTHFLDNIQIK